VVAPSEFAEDVIDRVRRASRLDLVIGERIRLVPAGNGQCKGSCPFHGEKFLSLRVAPTVRDGRFHCFGCGADGDVIDFVMAIDQLSYVDAVMRLAARAGIDLASPPDDQS
jgi:DNA primase